MKWVVAFILLAMLGLFMVFMFPLLLVMGDGCY